MYKRQGAGIIADADYADAAEFSTKVTSGTVKVGTTELSLIADKDKDGVDAVSYTHLDVYKRQGISFMRKRCKVIDIRIIFSIVYVDPVV